MKSNPPRNLHDHVVRCRAEVAEARATGDERYLCIALTDLGLALFRTREYQEGEIVFEEATTLATHTGDPPFQAQVLALHASAYQDIGRHHNAFEVANKIVELAESCQDEGMQCAAMTTQARILLDSGEPVLALERLKEARQLAERLDDKSYLMQIHSVLGNHKIAIAALEEAQTHFDMAAMIAAQIGDPRAECGYLIHKGTVLHWQKAFAQAVPVFEHALTLAVEVSDPRADLTCLRYLTEALHKAGEPERVPPLAERGIALARRARDHEAVFAFAQTWIMACYTLQQPAEAHRVLQETIAYARQIKDRNKEADMLLHLGESCIAFEWYEQALEAYRQALDALRTLGRATDEAHVVGRVGVVLAELGHLDEAIAHHEQAVALAAEQGLPALQAEQWAMLGLAYLDRGDPAQARAYGQQALDFYTAAGLDAQASNMRQVLAQIEAAGGMNGSSSP